MKRGAPSKTSDPSDQTAKKRRSANNSAPVKQTEKKLFAGKPGPGRPKGVPNKTTTLAKQAILDAFDKLGGTDALVKWAQTDDDHLKAFYTQIWPKVLPLQVTGEDGGAIIHRIERSIV